MSSLSSSSPRSIAWKGRPTRELVRLAWPITVSMLSFGAMTLVDTLFVGRLGSAALAGVGLGGVLSFALICFSIGLLRGAKVLVSQAVGAGLRDRLGALLGAALALALGLGALTVVLGVIAASLVPMLAATAAAGRAASAYLSVRTLGAPVVLALVALREHRYGEGDTRTPMIATLVANATNITLDALFIYGWGWGVEGSAWATILAQALELATLVALTRGALPRPTWSPSAMRSMLRVGVPSGLQFLLEVGSFAALTTIVSLLGEVEVAAHQIALQLTHISFLPALALGEASSVMAGQAVGGNEDGLVMRVAKSATLAAAAYMGAWSFAMIALGEYLVAPFTDDPTLIATTTRLLVVAACFQLADGAVTIARGVLRGTGDIRVPALYGIVTAWVCTPPLAYLLGAVAGLGALGGWIGLCAEIVVLCVLCWGRLLRGSWRTHADASRERMREEESEPALALA